MTLASSDRAERLGARLLPEAHDTRDFRILIERAFRAADTWREPVQVG